MPSSRCVVPDGLRSSRRRARESPDRLHDRAVADAFPAASHERPFEPYQPQDVSAGDIADSIRGGSMPPWFYTPLHPAARLSSVQQQRLVDGISRTFAVTPPRGGRG
jgi:hypothetical protein